MWCKGMGEREEHMRKKIGIIVAILFVALQLISCEQKSKLNDTNTRVANRVLSTVDDYIDGKISTENAYDIIGEEYNKIVEAGDLDTAEHADAYFFQSDVRYIHSDLLLISLGNSKDNVKDIIKSRNSIAKAIGRKEIK